MVIIGREQNDASYRPITLLREPHLQRCLIIQPIGQALGELRVDMLYNDDWRREISGKLRKEFSYRGGSARRRPNHYQRPRRRFLLFD